MNPTSELIFTPSVKAEQESYGSRSAYQRVESQGGFRRAFNEDFIRFVAERDSFYFATANELGQPYIQHRGGPKGFLKILDEQTLGFADFSGNQQFITVGTLKENKKVCLFLMDYPHQKRVKIWGEARVLGKQDSLAQSLLKDQEKYIDLVERFILIEVKAWDVNCPQYIQPRYTHFEMNHALENLQKRILELEKENQQLLRQFSKDNLKDG